jgi:hypothetical protein
MAPYKNGSKIMAPYKNGSEKMAPYKNGSNKKFIQKKLYSLYIFLDYIITQFNQLK